MKEIGSYGFAPEVSATDTYLSTTMKSMLSFPIMIHLMFPILPSVLAGMWIARFQLNKA